MCGRYSLTTPTEALRNLFGTEDRPNLEPRYNIAPTQLAPVVRLTVDDQPKLGMLRWGLIPHWSKDHRGAFKMINARSESAAQKSVFKEALGRRRCLVPADSFYEWKTEDGVRQPYRIMLRVEGPFAFAGLWERWRVPDGLSLAGEYASYSPGDVIETFTIMTTTPSPVIAALHNRMPVVVEPPHFSAWLSRESDPEDVLGLLRPYPGALKAHRVSTRLNKAGNDDPSCVEHVA